MGEATYGARASVTRRKGSEMATIINIIKTKRRCVDYCTTHNERKASVVAAATAQADDGSGAIAAQDVVAAQRHARQARHDADDVGDDARPPASHAGRRGARSVAGVAERRAAAAGDHARHRVAWRHRHRRASLPASASWYLTRPCDRRCFVLFCLIYELF